MELDAWEEVLDPRVRRITSYLLANLDKRLCLREIAGHVNLSDSHLAHLFRRDAGVAPQRFLKNLRLHRASDLLKTTFLSVKQIMASVGFNDPSHFVRDFKLMYGESPCQYRKHRLEPAACIRSRRQQKAGMANNEALSPQRSRLRVRPPTI